MPKLLNVKQLAAYLQIHEKTVYKWMKKGCLPAPFTRRGISPRWDAEEVLKYLQADDFRNVA